ncbi:MAG: efflux RND transporter periplasmic adaptor subunit [Alphaproteobacteria bacterium]|nr:efflux RND transporter periplasmic adaptor subunit [Alphaproteobacteria bacterium]MCB9695701.1 efflux RND transporter periplasmic adaptor subunit [Alphaproteobacteria bacterium]
MTPISILFLALVGCGSTSSQHDDHDEHGHDEHEAGVVELSPEALASARIVVAEAEEGTLEGGMSLPARVALDPRKEAIVSAWIAGQVDTIAVRPGDSVKRGQDLAQVQSPELGEAVAAFRTAKARDDAADARLERLRRLEADGVSSRAQVLEAEADHAEAEGSLEAAEERLRILGVPMDVGDPHAGEHFPSRVPVKSPIAGTVLEANASVGQRVEPGQALFRVGDLDHVWLLLDVYERDLSAVREGQTVRFAIEAWPDERFEGPVAQVGDWIEPDARTVEVRVVVDNPDHKLKPNMFATADLAVQREAERGIVLPADAIQRIDGTDVVFVEQEVGHFAARPVAVAERSAERVRLSSGLKPAERVVTEGAFALKSELAKGELGEGHAH